ncbi:MAG: Arm DNA-binding domain-containing protein, partial [Candidatus Hydrothermales bacterium]
MPKTKFHALNDLTIKKIKPTNENLKLWDGKGLYLLVTKSGSKLWRFNYIYNGKHKTIALGSYPEVSLSQARELAGELRKLLQQGIDPIRWKKEKELKRKNTFRAIAEEFLEKFSPNWDSSYTKTVKLRLEKYVFPLLGDLPID